MKSGRRAYAAIDLKSFYASVECRERDLDPLDTNLVVADPTRTDKTICLAVSPSLKACGIPGRPRLFEVVQQVALVNGKRKYAAPGHQLKGKSFSASELAAEPSLELDYIVAPPQMAKYMTCSTHIYSVYLKYIAPEDIHIYSIDEVFIDLTSYLDLYKLSPHDLTMKLVREVLRETGITATAGIGTNMYLAKIAMDIVAKHMPADKDGVRIAELDEMSYRRKLWEHRPITDFWRVGKGIAKRLEKYQLFTMGDIARCSLGRATDFFNEELLYQEFGVNAELLIDHAWGYEPTTIEMIKAYQPKSTSLSSGQVLQSPYESDKARLVALEMTDQLSLDLVAKGYVAPQLVLDIGYDIDNLKGSRAMLYKGRVVVDYYGRKVPAPAHGTINLEEPTSSTQAIMEAMRLLYDRIADKSLLVRRLTVTAANILSEGELLKMQEEPAEIDLFADVAGYEAEKSRKEAARRKEKALQKTVLAIKDKYGKNAMLKGMNLLPGATARERNGQVGGHRA